MNEEYLWSKKGNDPEIERLENLLSEFRFEPGSAPAFVSEPVEEPTGFFWRRLAWVFGIAAPSFALALFAFWIFTSGSNSELQVRSLDSNEAVAENRNETEPVIPIKTSGSGNKTERRSSKIKPKPTQVKTVYRSRKAKADRTNSLTAMNLTSEEKYAYDRLMLALSIAGTKLRVVQDTMDRTGELGKRSLSK